MRSARFIKNIAGFLVICALSLSAFALPARGAQEGSNRSLVSKPEIIGTYGGSFDPPTLAHLDVIRRAVGDYKLDKLYVYVNVDGGKNFSSSVQERIGMLKSALGDVGDRVEIQPNHNGALKKLSTLTGKPIYRFYGEDAFHTLPDTVNLNDPQYKWVVFERPSATGSYLPIPSAAANNVEVRHLPGFQETSSTQVRAELASGNSAAKGLDPAVAGYIQKHSLYPRFTAEQLPAARALHEKEFAEFSARASDLISVDLNDLSAPPFKEGQSQSGRTESFIRWLVEKKKLEGADRAKIENGLGPRSPSPKDGLAIYNLRNGDIVEGSVGHGGTQPDFLIDTESPAFRRLTEEAKKIASAREGVESKIAAIEELIRQRVLLDTEYTSPTLRALNQAYLSEGKPVPLSKFIQHNAGVCREYAMVTHFLLKAAGIPNRYAYVKIEKGYENGRKVVEDHAMNIIKVDGVEWIVDSKTDRFNGYRLSDAVRPEGLTSSSPKLSYAAGSNSYRRIMQINPFPLVHRKGGIVPSATGAGCGRSYSSFKKNSGDRTLR